MSQRPAKPENTPRLIPYLMVRNAEAAIEFYQKAFGFEVRMDPPLKGPDGRIMHAEMRFMDTVIMFAPENAMGGKSASPKTSGTTSPITLYVYCDDADAMYKRAVSAGAISMYEPNTAFWGDRTCAVIDPDGYCWMFATNVADFDPSKIPPQCPS